MLCACPELILTTHVVYCLGSGVEPDGVSGCYVPVLIWFLQHMLSTVWGVEWSQMEFQDVVCLSS